MASIPSFLLGTGQNQPSVTVARVAYSNCEKFPTSSNVPLAVHGLRHSTRTASLSECVIWVRLIGDRSGPAWWGQADVSYWGQVKDGTCPQKALALPYGPALSIAPCRTHPPITSAFLKGDRFKIARQFGGAAMKNDRKIHPSASPFLGSGRRHDLRLGMTPWSLHTALDSSILFSTPAA